MKLKVSRIVMVTVVAGSVLSGCTSNASTPSASPTSVNAGTATPEKLCAEEQSGQGGLLTFNQVWPTADFAEGSARMVSLNAAKCRQAADTVICERPFPWVVAQADGLLGHIGAKLWGQSELTGGAGSRTQNLRQSIVVFATPQYEGINMIGERAKACGLVRGSDGIIRGSVKGVQEELHNLGRVQLILEFGGDWQPAEAERVRKAAIAAARTL